MINIERALKSNRIIKSLTGLDIEKFKELLPYFELIVQEESGKKIKADRDRKRAIGGGNKHTLSSIEYQLFFILFYLKVYPTFDVAGFFFNVDRSQTNRWVHKLLPILEKTLERKMVLPKRRIESVTEFMKLFPEVKDLFIDGTERQVQRSKDNKEQRLNYSGKKKTHTIKNLVVNDEKKRIICVTQTVRGSMHDKKMYDREGLDNVFPDNVTQWLDTGFLGVGKTSKLDIQMPKKKPKGKELTPIEKENNRTISSLRVVNEHAIGGIKRMQSVSTVYRNKKANTADKMMVICAGIWNHFIAA